MTEKIENTVEVNSTSGRTAEEIQALQHTTVAVTGISDLLARDEAVASRVAVAPHSLSVSKNTDLSIVLAEESASLTSIRNGVIEGTCAKVLNFSPAVESVSNIIQMKAAFAQEGSCHVDNVPPNVSVLMFNDTKDSEGYFVNGVVAYGPIGKDEIVSVIDRANGKWDNYCDPTIEAVDSLDVFWDRKSQIEKAGGNTYILVTDRQRGTFNWLVFTKGNGQLDAVVSVYQSVALSQLVVNGTFMMELRDLAYEDELYRSSRAA